MYVKKILQFLSSTRKKYRQKKIGSFYLRHDVNKQTSKWNCDSQLSNIMGQIWVSSGNLWSVIGHDSVADTLHTHTPSINHTLALSL